MGKHSCRCYEIPGVYVHRMVFPATTLIVSLSYLTNWRVLMAPQSPRQRRAHSDPIGAVLAQMSHHDQLVVIATAVGGYTDSALIRLLPNVTWREPRRVPRRPNVRRRIEKAYERLGHAVVIADFEIEADRMRVKRLIARCAYWRSPYVREICLCYGIDSDPRRRCAAPGCNERLDEPPGRRAGRPRATCSNACRQRLWRHRQAT